MDFSRFFLIAGPCVIESFEHLYEVATHIKKITDKMGVRWVLKSSYDKANRTSIESFRGIGMGRGMSALYKAKSMLDCEVTTDFHSVEQIESYGTTVDIVQVPAFLCRQTDIIEAAARTQKPVNVKKGQFISPGGIPDIVRKLSDCGCGDILITERGTQFGYSDVVVDFRRFHMPTPWVDVLDVTHSVSDWRQSLPLAKAALALGVRGIFCEVGSTLCDENRSIPLEEFERFLGEIAFYKYFN